MDGVWLLIGIGVLVGFGMGIGFRLENWFCTMCEKLGAWIGKKIVKLKIYLGVK